MSKFVYVTPSGAKYTLTSAETITPAVADIIFYTQMAAGTFVGYQPGDKLTHPAQAINNFGLTRLERGTAGVDDRAILAAIANLPVVVPLPALSNVPISNPVTTADFVGVTSDPTVGRFSLGPKSVGALDETEAQALMAQIAAQTAPPSTTSTTTTTTTTQGQAYNAITVAYGVGKYGFNAQQLERVGCLKPGTTEKYFNIDPTTQANPPNFVSLMQQTNIWTDDNIFGVKNINDILSSPATQNKIQQALLKLGYSELVALGTITEPKTKTTTKPVSAGLVYGAQGTLVQVSPAALISSSPLNATSSGTPIDTIPTSVSSLGNASENEYAVGLSSISSGAVNLRPAQTTSGTSRITQIAGAVGVGAAVFGAASALASNLKGDIGALVANASKFGTGLTSLWASGTTSLGSLSSLTNGLPSIGSISMPNLSSLTSNLPGLGSLSSGLSSQLDSLGKASQFGINFADFNIGGLVSSVTPAPGFLNTVDRSQVDAALTRVIGSSKISTPAMVPPSPASLGNMADISQAQNLLKGATGLVNGVTSGALGPISGQLGGLTSSLGGIGSIGSLASGGGIGGALGATGVNISGATGSASTTTSIAEQAAARKAAVQEMESTQVALDNAIAEYGTLSPQAEAARLANKQAIAKADALG